MYFLIVGIASVALILIDDLFQLDYRPTDHETFLNLISGANEIDSFANAMVVYFYGPFYKLFDVAGIYIVNMIVIIPILVLSSRILDRNAFARFFICMAPTLIILATSVQREILLTFGSILLLWWSLGSDHIKRVLVAIAAIAAMLVRPIYCALIIYHVALRNILFRSMLIYSLLITPLYMVMLNTDYYYLENITRLSSAIDNSSSYLGERFLENHGSVITFMEMIAYNFIMNLFGGLFSFLRNIGNSTLMNPIGFGNLIASIMVGLELLRAMLIKSKQPEYIKFFLSLVLFVSTASWVWGPRYIYPFLILIFLANSHPKLESMLIKQNKLQGRSYWKRLIVKSIVK